MKPDDIRQLNMKCQESAMGASTTGERDIALRSLEMSLLAEIATQLAILNEGLGYVSRSQCLSVRVEQK